MSVAHPMLAVAAVLAAAVVGFLYLRFDGRRRSEAFAYSNLAFLLDATRATQGPARIVAAALALGVLLGTAAFAGVRVNVPVPERGGAVVLCLDTSGSMRATDIEPSREIAVRAAARAYVQSAPAETRIALAAFSSDAQQISELSADKAATLDALANVPPANGATAIGDCLMLAGRVLPASGRRLVILVTDGISNRGEDPLEAATALGKRGIRIVTIGIGTNGSGIAIPGTSEEAAIDEDTLRAIAVAGGGAYHRVGDATALTETFRDLARSAVWERRRVDISLPLALAGCATLTFTLLGAFLAGRFP